MQLLEHEPVELSNEFPRQKADLAVWGDSGYFEAPTFAITLPATRTYRLSAAQALIKRMMDVIGALIGLVVLFPAGSILALIVRATSKGPVFFRQNRLAYRCGVFQMLKFRSMQVDADALLKDILDADPMLRAEYDKYHKLRHDPRITGIGRFLRKFSLDEFPQLMNVLRGDMSIVGPRPYLPDEAKKMGGHDQTILSVRPGLTGLWQTGGRNALTFHERLHMDVEYVRKWSLWLDLVLIFRTIPVILGGEESY